MTRSVAETRGEGRKGKKEEKKFISFGRHISMELVTLMQISGKLLSMLGFDISFKLGFPMKAVYVWLL